MAWVRVKDRVTGKESLKSEGVAKMLKDKYEILSEGVEEGLIENPVKKEEQKELPNEAPGEKKTADVDETDGVDLANARAEYERLYGEKPHGRLKLVTLQKLIAEKNAG